MGMDYLRSCYRSQMNFFTEEPTSVDVTWKWAAETARVLPYWTPFRSRVWIRGYAPPPEEGQLGETSDPPHPWSNGENLSDLPGTATCTVQELWEAGQDAPLVDEEYICDEECMICPFWAMEDMQGSNGTVLTGRPPPLVSNGTTWAQDTNGLWIQSNRAEIITPNVLAWQYLDTQTMFDAQIQAEITPLVVGIPAGYLMLRYVDANNYWLGGVRCSVPTLAIVRVLAGVSTIAASVSRTWVAGTTYNIVFRVVGDDFELTDGTNTVNHTSSVHNSGTRHGIWIANNNANKALSNIAIDRVRIGPSAP